MTPPPPAAARRRAPHGQAALARRVARLRRPAAGSSPSRAGAPVALPRLCPRPPRMPRRALSLRGRARAAAALIVVFGVLLLGLVFLQVSLLKLNTAISVNVERAAQLERDNAQARATSRTWTPVAASRTPPGKLGMVMPAAGAICFLNARRAGSVLGRRHAAAGGSRHRSDRPT